MTIFLAAMLLLSGSGLASLLARRSPKTATVVGAGGAALACVIALPGVILGLFAPPVSLQLPWSVPGGSFYIEIDPLSAFFLVPTLLLSALSALYGGQYLLASGGKDLNHGASWFFFNLLVASMVLVIIARNAVLFLMAWELMTLASFFLVTFDRRSAEAQEAGWLYLISTHLGTALLLILFLLLGRDSLDFDHFTVIAAPGLLFLLAVAGFGTKAGLLPFHVWLPEAHPAAPSHVSALMSGIMIKTGIYGLLRILTFLPGPPPLWWGGTLVAIGLASVIFGILWALTQHNLKRLLAYSSIENVGIIAVGIGLGLTGVSAGNIPLAALGFAGALLHVWNHALFKGLLFLGAGAVLHAAHGVEINRLGGLLKRMPWTGAAFFVGSAAICALPPLNGFVGEFLIYLGALSGTLEKSGDAVFPAIIAIGGLALAGGLAVACFTNVFGMVFLGEPRSSQTESAHEVGWWMRIPMFVMAAGCVLIGLFGGATLDLLIPVVRQMNGLSSPASLESLFARTGEALQFVGLAGAMVLSLTALLVLLRRSLLARRGVGASVTWGCGYTRPSPRMQYTASSFAHPLAGLFAFFLRARTRQTGPEGLFPKNITLETHTPDWFRHRVFEPLFMAVDRIFTPLRWIQHGRMRWYVLYVAATLVLVLAWKLP